MAVGLWILPTKLRRIKISISQAIFYNLPEHFVINNITARNVTAAKKTRCHPPVLLPTPFPSCPFFSPLRTRGWKYNAPPKLSRSIQFVIAEIISGRDLSFSASLICARASAIDIFFFFPPLFRFKRDAILTL